mgnify:CR=1 FL=1
MKNARYDWKRGVLPMELITRSRERRRIAIIVVALVLALLIALAYTIVSSRQATAAAVETMSEVYLQELSNQVISHFNTGIDGKFCQLETVGSSLELYDPENLDEVRDFLACMEADDDEYAYLRCVAATGSTTRRGARTPPRMRSLPPAASWGCRIGTRTATT